MYPKLQPEPSHGLLLMFSWPSGTFKVICPRRGRINSNTLNKKLLFQMSKKVLKYRLENQAQDEADSTIGTVMVHKPKARKPISPTGFQQSCNSAFKRK